MQIRNATALLLDVFDLQERDRIVTFLTAEWGKKRGVARGSRTKYSRFAGRLQPLAKVAVSWFEKDGRDLVRISDVSLVRPAAAIQETLEDILLTSYLAEHMKEFAQEEENSERLFRLLDSTLEALLSGTDRPLAARYFEVWMLRLSGIFPVPRECPLCGRPYAGKAVFLESEAILVCDHCGADHRQLEVGPTELEFLVRSGRESLAKLEEKPPSPQALSRIETLCARIRRHFLQSELKSYRVMLDTLKTL
ncbi:MAG: DNA repair protein RecO [Thermoanaerobaculia bacterium]